MINYPKLPFVMRFCGMDLISAVLLLKKLNKTKCV